MFDDELARLEDQITVAQIEANEAQIDHLDLESVLAFAEHVLVQAGRLWLEFDLRQKAMASESSFPKRVAVLEWGI
jgi:hypothetical protein